MNQIIYIGYMLIVKVNSNIERALKSLKSKVINTKQNQRLVKLKEFKKKSVEKREKLMNAKYVQYIRTQQEQ